MPQRCCPWCSSLGVYVSESDLGSEHAMPHADGSSCVCRHVTCHTEKSARREGGRWWDGSAWRCAGGCDPAQGDR